MATMTETVTVPYSPKVFHGLEDHFEASEKLEHVNGVEWMREVGKALLEKHNLDETLGFVLLHRHFDLKDNEILVQYENTTTPWPDVEKVIGNSGKVSGSSWKLIADEGQGGTKYAWMPYEFSFDPARETPPVDLNDPKYKAFLEEFAPALRSAGLDQLIGLSADLNPLTIDGLEITMGQTNILLRPGQFDPAAAKNGIKAWWSFSGGYRVRACQRHTLDGGWYHYGP